MSDPHTHIYIYLKGECGRVVVFWNTTVSISHSRRRYEWAIWYFKHCYTSCLIRIFLYVQAHYEKVLRDFSLQDFVHESPSPIRVVFIFFENSRRYSQVKVYTGINSVNDTGGAPWTAKISANFRKYSNRRLCNYQGLGGIQITEKPEAENLVINAVPLLIFYSTENVRSFQIIV